MNVDNINNIDVSDMIDENINNIGVNKDNSDINDEDRYFINENINAIQSLVNDVSVNGIKIRLFVFNQVWSHLHWCYRGGFRPHHHVRLAHGYRMNTLL